MSGRRRRGLRRPKAALASAGERGDGSVGGDAADHVGVAVGDVNVAGGIHRHAAGEFELRVDGRAAIARVPGAAGAGDARERAVAIDAEDGLEAGEVGDAGGIDSDSRGVSDGDTHGRRRRDRRNSAGQRGNDIGLLPGSAEKKRRKDESPDHEDPHYGGTTLEGFIGWARSDSQRSTRRAPGGWAGGSRVLSPASSSAEVSPVWTAMERIRLARAALTSAARRRSGRWAPADPALRARVADGEAGQAGAGGGHLSEGAEAEVIAEAGAFEFAPADAREIAGHQCQQDAAPREAFEQGATPGQCLSWSAGQTRR